jgi:rhodanese-related sulfurtransferase
VITEIGPVELANLLGTAPCPLVLDVRETWELELASLPGVLNIPMAQIPDRLDELCRDREIVVMCHHGARSFQVAVFLKHSGFETVINLAGGIDAWSREVDPGVPLY